MRLPVAAKQMTAWLSDEPMIYDKLTPYEYLEFVAGLWRTEPATLRGIFQGHAPEGGAGRCTRSRSEADISTSP